MFETEINLRADEPARILGGRQSPSVTPYKRHSQLLADTLEEEWESITHLYNRQHTWFNESDDDWSMFSTTLQREVQTLVVFWSLFHQQHHVFKVGLYCRRK